MPKGFPRFTLQPHMQGVENGLNALLPCKAEGDPEPTITWLKDMRPIDLSNPRYKFYQGCKYQFDILIYYVLDRQSINFFLINCQL